MKTRNIIALAGVLFVCCSGGKLLQAQEALSVQIPFEFKMGDQSLPPGAYKIESLKHAGQSLWITNKASSNRVAIPYLTRISARKDAKPCVVFDSAGGTSYLTEVYFSASDGYYLKGAPGEHKHTELNAKD